MEQYTTQEHIIVIIVTNRNNHFIFQGLLKFVISCMFLP